jgi:hypothetical protein
MRRGRGVPVRRGSRHERRWNGWFDYDGGNRQGAERRAVWDIRCREAPCARVNGRKSARTLKGIDTLKGTGWALHRRRRRAGGRFY